MKAIGILIAVTLVDLVLTWAGLPSPEVAEANPLYAGRFAFCLAFRSAQLATICAVWLVAMRFDVPRLLRVLARAMTWGCVVVGALACLWNAVVLVLAQS